MTDVPEYLEQILNYAALAPSSHNCRPWNVTIRSDSELTIGADPTRRLPEVDPTNRETLLSIGAFWENLEQSADALGFETHTDIIAATLTDTDILEVKLKRKPQPQTHPSTHPVLKLMETRATNRKKYKPTPLSPSHLETCGSLLPTHLTYYPRESEKGLWISTALVEAMRQQVFDDGKQAELAKWLRFSRTEAKERGDGLTAEMLGLSGLLKFVWYAFMNERHAMSRLFRNGAVKGMKDRVKHCAGFFVITSDDGSVQSLLQAGRDFERLALKCTELNIAVHPVSQMIQESPWNEQLQKELKLSKPAQWMLCVGYPCRRFKPACRFRRPRCAWIRLKRLAHETRERHEKKEHSHGLHG